VDHLDVASLGAVFAVWAGVGLWWCQQGLDVVNDAGQQTQEAEVFAEAAAGFLVRLLEGAYAVRGPSASGPASPPPAATASARMSLFRFDGHHRCGGQAALPS
jgi:hypothetical protein